MTTRGGAKGKKATHTSQLCMAKLVLLGEGCSGKTSLVLRFIKGEYVDCCTTIGTTFFQHTLHLDDAEVKLEIWDTPGYERFHSVAPFLFRRAQASIVVYDITSEYSFVRAKLWVKELRKQTSDDMVIALSGNKADLSNKREVTQEEARFYAEENGLLFMETSAKTAANVSELFMEIVRRLPKSGNLMSQVSVRSANRHQALQTDAHTSNYSLSTSQQQGGGGCFK